MKQHILKKMMPGVGVFVAIAMMTTGFAGSAFAQTTDNATTTNNTATSTTDNNATTTGVATSTPVQIMIMKHLCNANIKKMSDFMSMQQGLDQVSAFVKVEANCPTTGLIGNNSMSGTIAAPRMNFDFSVMGPNGATNHISSATFENKKLCESDVNRDIDNNGQIATSTCLDASDYVYPWIASTTNGQQMTTVTETDVPAGYHYGAVLFTPPQIDNNNDAASLVSSSSMDTTGTGAIVLNTATDTDRMIMLHVFNFRDTGNATTTATSTDNGGGTATSTNNGGNNNNGGTGTTTSTTTPSIFDINFQIARLNAIVNILQRVEDIQSRIVDIVASLASGGWNMISH